MFDLRITPEFQKKGEKMNQVWEKSEERFIRENADTMKDKEIAFKLSQITGRTVTIQAVRKKRQQMGIKKVRGRGKCAVVKNNNQGTKAADVVAVSRKL